jgi:protoporphyrinogen oxidase
VCLKPENRVIGRVLTIGAGPAGLTAAYELTRLGIPATVLEADNQVGGLSRTVNYRGYRFDIGGHRFFSKIPLINDLWQEILHEEFLVRPRLSRIYYRDHFFDYPLKAVNALAGLGPVEALLIVLSYTKARLWPHSEERNLEQWVSNRFGERLYEIFFKTYTEKVWGMPCTEISADWAAQRIKNLSLREALRSALLGDQRGQNDQIVTSLIEQFRYPRLGPGMMWERCRELVAERGCETVGGFRVERIRHRGGRVECILGRDSEGKLVELTADHYISTMPLRDLIEALDPAPPEEVLRAARNLRYRDYLTVVLIVDREAVFPDNWIYIHAPEVKVGRVQNYKNWSPDMVPDQSRTSLGLEYFLWKNDDQWGWADERLIDLGVREAAQVGLLDPHEVEDGTIVRMPKAYPVYDPNYQASLATISSYLATISNLQTVGRNGLHRYNNQDHSMLTGIYAARNIAGEKNDVWSVNTEMDYLESSSSSSVQVGVPAGGHAGGQTGVLAGDRLVPAAVVGGISPDALIEQVFAKLDPIALGTAVSVVSGVGLFIASAWLLLKGGPVVGPNLSLLGQYLIGFQVTWPGALIGLVEASVWGFVIGYSMAFLRNWSLAAYASLVRHRAEARERRDLLDRI